MTAESELCRVQSVTVKNGAILVTAQHLERPSVVYNRLPLMADFSGVVAVPEVNQKVIVTETSNGTEYVEGVLTTAGSDAPSLSSGELALQFDVDTRVSFTENDSGNIDVNIEASGDIFVGSNGVPVAKQDHTHPTGSGDTGTPNESGTTTKIE